MSIQNKENQQTKAPSKPDAFFGNRSVRMPWKLPYGDHFNISVYFKVVFHSFWNLFYVLLLCV